MLRDFSNLFQNQFALQLSPKYHSLLTVHFAFFTENAKLVQCKYTLAAVKHFPQGVLDFVNVCLLLHVGGTSPFLRQHI